MSKKCDCETPCNDCKCKPIERFNKSLIKNIESIVRLNKDETELKDALELMLLYSKNEMKFNNQIIKAKTGVMKWLKNCGFIESYNSGISKIIGINETVINQTREQMKDYISNLKK